MWTGWRGAGGGGGERWCRGWWAGWGVERCVDDAGSLLCAFHGVSGRCYDVMEKERETHLLGDDLLAVAHDQPDDLVDHVLVPAEAHMPRLLQSRPGRRELQPGLALQGVLALGAGEQRVWEEALGDEVGLLLGDLVVLAGIVLVFSEWDGRVEERVRHV